jgi:hypothetical protein
MPLSFTFDGFTLVFVLSKFGLTPKLSIIQIFYCYSLKLFYVLGVDTYFNDSEFTSDIQFPYYYTVDSCFEIFVKNGRSTRPEEKKK